MPDRWVIENAGTQIYQRSFSIKPKNIKCHTLTFIISKKRIFENDLLISITYKQGYFSQTQLLSDLQATSY